MNTETYANSPIKSCDNCAYRIGRGQYARCGRAGLSCAIARCCATHYDSQCDENFSGWRAIPPKPPRRSLRQWLWEMLWK